MTEDQPQLPEQSAQSHATSSQAVPPQPQGPPVVTAEQWAARFWQTHPREPTKSEYQAVVQAGLIAPERRPRDPSMQLMADGAKQVVNGCAGLLQYQGRAGCRELCAAGPLVSGAGQAEGAGYLHPPAAAFLAIISLFMPVASAVGISVSFLMGSVGGTRYASVGAGVALLALLSVVMLAAAVLILLSPRQTRAVLPGRPPLS
ncbi:hypothetical protein ACWCQQ_38425 [Streptomyces sp. NPDC002143]